MKHFEGHADSIALPNNGDHVEGKPQLIFKKSDKENLVISEPRPEDILCGKDKACVTHEGSRRFRTVIDTYQEKYSKCVTKQQKMDVTKEIVESLERSSGSRFLKYDTESDSWQEITHTAARDKVSHALRFASQRQERQEQRKETRPVKLSPPPLPSTSTPEVTSRTKAAVKKKTVEAVLPSRGTSKKVTVVKAKARRYPAKRRNFSDPTPFSNLDEVKLWDKFVKRQQNLLMWIQRSCSDGPLNTLMYDAPKFIPVEPLSFAVDAFVAEDDEEIAMIVNEVRIAEFNRRKQDQK